MLYGLRRPKRYPLQMIQISLRNDENGENNDDSENNVDGETNNIETKEDIVVGNPQQLSNINNSTTPAVTTTTKTITTTTFASLDGIIFCNFFHYLFLNILYEHINFSCKKISKIIYIFRNRLLHFLFFKLYMI